MKSDERNSEETLNKALGLFSEPSVGKMESARERVSQRFDSAHEYRDAQAEIPLVRPIRNFRWPAVAGIAAAIVVAILVPATALRSAPAVLEDAAGSRKIGFGEVVRPNGERGGTLTLVDGTRVEMRAESELSLERGDEGVKVRLRKGDFIVDAAPQTSGQLSVQTRDISAVGQTFLVNAKEEGSRVTAIVGEARVQQGGAEWTLRAGERVATNPAIWQSSAQNDVSWSRSAETQLQLQQAIASMQALTKLVRGEAFEETSVRPSAGGPRGASGPLQSPCNGAGPQVDPGRFSAPYVSVYRLITWAYGKECIAASRNDLLSGGPSWVRSEPYAIEATIPSGSPAYTVQDVLKGNAPKLQKMLQNLLIDRFKLTARTETKEMPVYNLVMGKDTGRLKLSDDQTPVDLAAARAAGSKRGNYFFSTDPATRLTTVSANAFSMQTLLDMWLPLADRPVVNKIDLKGLYDIAPFQFAPDTSSSPVGGRSQMEQFFEQLGFKLESAKAPVEVLVIDRVEKPTEN